MTRLKDIWQDHYDRYREDGLCDLASGAAAQNAVSAMLSDRADAAKERAREQCMEGARMAPSPADVIQHAKEEITK